MKASNSNRFVTSFYQKYKDEMQEHPDFWVLYRLAQDGGEEFFVLTHQEMAVAQAARNFPGEDLTWVEHAERVIHGVDNVMAGDLHPYTSAWDKIVRYCTT